MHKTMTTLMLSTMMAIPAMAQETPRDFVNTFSRQAPVADVLYRDMDGDGFQEALIRLDECADDKPDLCSWVLAAKTQTGWGVVGSGQAETISFDERGEQTFVINADGVIWTWDGAHFLPGLGLLYETRAREAVAQDIALIVASTDFEDLARRNVGVYALDLTGDGTSERVFMINDSFYRVGTWGTPYIIATHDDTIISQGVSSDLPRVFRRPEGGFSIIEIGPRSMSEIIVE